jgi:hypothetical protein
MANSSLMRQMSEAAELSSSEFDPDLVLVQMANRMLRIVPIGATRCFELRPISGCAPETPVFISPFVVRHLLAGGLLLEGCADTGDKGLYLTAEGWRRGLTTFLVR